MKQIYHATASERQHAIVAHDWQLFAEHPGLVVIARPYRMREAPQIAADPESSAKVAQADRQPEQWAMIVVNALSATYRLLVRRDQARNVYDTILREYRRREPRATGRYELERDRPGASDIAGELAS